MKIISFGAALLLALTPTIGASKSATRLPDFSGRDKKFAYMKTRIVEGLKAGPNFAGHYTIIRAGCGTGCTSNLMVDRTTGRVIDVPYGGEIQQQLNLRYRVTANNIVASWFDGDLCVAQEARWNGSTFTLSQSPRGRPDSFCNG